MNDVEQFNLESVEVLEQIGISRPVYVVKSQDGTKYVAKQSPHPKKEILVARVLSQHARFEDETAFITSEQPIGISTFGNVEYALFHHYNLLSPVDVLHLHEERGTPEFSHLPGELEVISAKYRDEELFPKIFARILLAYAGIYNDRHQENQANTLNRSRKSGVVVLDFEDSSIAKREVTEATIDFQFQYFFQVLGNLKHEEISRMNPGERREYYMDICRRFVPSLERRTRSLLGDSGYFQGRITRRTQVYEALKELERRNYDLSD